MPFGQSEKLDEILNVPSHVNVFTTYAWRHALGHIIRPCCWWSHTVFKYIVIFSFFTLSKAIWHDRVAEVYLYRTDRHTVYVHYLHMWYITGDKPKTGIYYLWPQHMYYWFVIVRYVDSENTNARGQWLFLNLIDDAKIQWRVRRRFI